MLPKDFPPWQAVYGYFRRWQRQGYWQKMHDALRARVCERSGKPRQPTAGILDSQSVKVAEQGGPRGYDAGKKVTGLKRHVLVDTLGLMLAVLVTEAHVQDRDGARRLLARCKIRLRKASAALRCCLNAGSGSGRLPGC